MQEVTNTVTRILLNHRIDSYNTKLILSCLKQTLTLTLILTLGPVTPTETITPGSGGRGRGGRGNDCGKIVAKYSFDGKMKDGPLSKLTITKGGQQATQYKEIIEALPVFCADKGYKFIDDIIWTNTKRLQASFLPLYPDAGRWSNTYHVEVVTVDANAQPDVNTGLCPRIVKVQEKTHVLTRIFRSNYYWNTIFNVNSGYKNGLNSLPTRGL